MTANVFQDLEPALNGVLAAMAIETPTPIQAGAIPPLREGRDVVGQARTGSGKTLAFGLPLVERIDPATRGVQALVLVPTRELALQVGDVIGKLAQARRLRMTHLYGGRSLLPERQALRTGVHIVVGTPGRTLDHLRQSNLDLRGVRVLVLDEADEMLDRGFAPDVERIISFTPPTRQTVMFSATVPAWVGATAAKHLREPVRVQVDRDQDTPPEIEHVVYEVPTDAKLEALRALLDNRGEGPMLVFGRTKHGVKKLAKQLMAMGYPAAALQGNMSQNARERVMAEFRSGEVPVLLATNVAARGIDVGGIEQVINYELPESAELFTHRSGRTGRMGRQGEVITFITPEDEAKWRQMERQLGRRLPRRTWGQRAGAPTRHAPAQSTNGSITTDRPVSPRGRETGVVGNPAPRREMPGHDARRRDHAPRTGTPNGATPPTAEGQRAERERRRRWFRRASSSGSR